MGRKSKNRGDICIHIADSPCCTLETISGFPDGAWRRKWQPTPVFLPEEFHEQRSLVGCSPWSHKELAMTESLSLRCTSGKNLPAQAGDIRNTGSIPGWGRVPGGGHSNPLQYSCLENSHGQKSLVGYGL